MPVIRFLDCSPVDGQEMKVRETPVELYLHMEPPLAKIVDQPADDTIPVNVRRYVRGWSAPPTKDDAGRLVNDAALVYVWDRLWHWSHQ